MNSHTFWVVLLMWVGCQAQPAVQSHLFTYQATQATDLPVSTDRTSGQLISVPESVAVRFDSLIEQHILRGLDSTDRALLLPEVRQYTQRIPLKKGLFFYVIHLFLPDSNQLIGFLYASRSHRVSPEAFVWPGTFYEDKQKPALKRPFLFLKGNELILREKKHNGTYNALVSHHFRISTAPHLILQRTTQP